MSNGNNTQLPQEDSYEAGEKVMPMADTMEEDETTTGEMMQMSNIPMNGGGFSMNGSTQEMKKEDLSMNDSFNSNSLPIPIKKKEKKEQRAFESNNMEMVEQNEIQEHESNRNAMSEDSEDESEMKEKKSDSDGISEDEFTFINPPNVYKFQDAFDDDNDYMAYAS